MRHCSVQGAECQLRDALNGMLVGHTGLMADSLASWGAAGCAPTVRDTGFRGVLGLLLRHAVERAEAEDQVAAGDADDFAAGEEFGEFVEGDAVIGVIERGHDDEIICDVEICVARG